MATGGVCGRYSSSTRPSKSDGASMRTAAGRISRATSPSNRAAAGLWCRTGKKTTRADRSHRGTRSMGGMHSTPDGVAADEIPVHVAAPAAVARLLVPEVPAHVVAHLLLVEGLGVPLGPTVVEHEAGDGVR